MPQLENFNVDYDTGDQAGGGYLAFPGTLWVNESGIQLDPEKELARPQGIEEIDGYGESSRDGRYEAYRTFWVPWSIRKAFLDWAMGYGVTSFGGQALGFRYTVY